jgi:amidase
MDEPAVTRASAATLARWIREGELSSVEVVEAHLARIGAVNPALNAVVCLTAETARAEARAADEARSRGELRGPLHGVPMTIKDSFETAGVRSTCGTLGLAEHVPAEDAMVVARLKDAGAILLGKTNTPELTLAFETDNLVYGRSNNPYDLSRSPGGSSGGAAAIIAAGGSPFDLGSDTGGSIRLPAHFCGIAGLKPTSGRVPRTGHLYPPGGFRDAWTTLGPMARYVEDLALLLPLISGPDWRDPAAVPVPLRDPTRVTLQGLRIAVYTHHGSLAPTPETAETVLAAARALEAAGGEVKNTRPPYLPLTDELVSSLWAVDGGHAIDRLLSQYGTTRRHKWLKRDPKYQWRGTAAELGELLLQQDQFRSWMLEWMADYDLILCPPCAYPASPHDTCQHPDYWEGYTYLLTYNVTGWPVAVVRCGTTAEGLPIGVQVVAQPWREDVALAAAAHLETVFGGWQPPDLEASHPSERRL